MKVDISTGRLKYEPNYGYQDGVLIGKNWFEEKLRYVREKHKHETTYVSDYTDKEPSAVHPNIFWNNKLAGEGLDRAILMDHEGNKYHENYSSVYDLSYNHLPKCKRPKRIYNTMRQIYLPEQDLALNYGNVTNYGLRKSKEKLWNYQNFTTSASWTTEVRDCYLKPKLDEYCWKRRGIPRDMSSKLHHVNLENIHLPLRGQPFSVVPDVPLVVKERPYPHFYF